MPSPTEIERLPSGASWLKVDLHVHTPASVDMDERWISANPEDLVQIALRQGLDAIAITDHNSVEWCEKVRESAIGTPLAVFPGVEISTPQGHILAIFDRDISISRIEDLLVNVGFEREEFGSLDVASRDGIVDVSSAISAAGGIAIAAHADAARGFLKTISVGAERKRVYRCPDLWAMELLDLTDKQDHQAGNRFGRRMTCVQGSDSWVQGTSRHQLDGVGGRHTFLKLDECSLSGLKMAFINPEIRVRTMGESSPSPRSSIVGMWITNGFLADERFRFNENVNCLIGDTGSGKSVTMELIRFGLAQPPRVKKIRAEVDRLLQQQLGELGTIHLFVRKENSNYLVERTWGIPSAEPLVHRISDNGLELIQGLDIASFFSIKSFSQSEIIEFAREPEVRLSLTDDLIDCSTEDSQILELKTSLKSNSANICSEYKKEHGIRERLEERAGLVETTREIDKVLTDGRIAGHQHWYREQTLLKNTKSQVEQLSGLIPGAFKPLVLSEKPAEIEADVLNVELLHSVQQAINNWNENLVDIEKGLQSALTGMQATLKEVRDKWNAQFKLAELAYRDLLNELDSEGIGVRVLSARRKTLQERISKLDKQRRVLETTVLPRIRELETERDQLLTCLQDNRKSITQKREQKARQLTEKLDNKIRLKVQSRSHREKYYESLLEISKGSFLKSAEIRRAANICHPIVFVKQLLANDFDGLSSITDLSSPKLSKLWDTILERDRLAGLYELQLADLGDVIQVQLKVSNGEYKQLEELSHGQKCMVVLMVALAEGDFPLLVDQPEDALHAPSIEEGIVETLRSGRGSRQCLFATRNANILVSADAEQIIALSADAERGRIAITGSLDRFDLRSLTIYHVEGGEEAFRRRNTMYTLELPTES